MQNIVEHEGDNNRRTADRASESIQARPKGLWLELIANFKMMQFDFNGQVMLLLVAKGEMDYTNVQRRKISERIESIKHIPAVFYFDNLLTYERDRLVEQECILS